MDQETIDKLERLENIRESFALRVKIKVLDKLRKMSKATGKSVNQIINEAIDGIIAE